MKSAALPLLAALLLACAREPPPRPPPRFAYAAPAPTWAAARALGFAEAQLGKPYCWGGTGPSCFDCSGLVHAAWLAAGLSLPRTSDALARALPSVDPAYALPGDVLWKPGHVALYAGGGYAIEAPQTGETVRYRTASGFARVLRP